MYVGHTKSSKYLYKNSKILPYSKTGQPLQNSEQNRLNYKTIQHLKHSPECRCGICFLLDNPMQSKEETQWCHKTGSMLLEVDQVLWSKLCGLDVAGSDVAGQIRDD